MRMLLSNTLILVKVSCGEAFKLSKPRPPTAGVASLPPIMVFPIYVTTLSKFFVSTKELIIADPPSTRIDV